MLREGIIALVFHMQIAQAGQDLVVLGLDVHHLFLVGYGGVAFCFGAGFRGLGSRLLIWSPY